MPCFEYMRLKLTDLPNNSVQQYNLSSKVTIDGYIYKEIRRGMYGLPQAGLLAQQLWEKCLNSKGTHKWHPISFSLCVDDFSMEYNGKQHADHLVAVLKENYTISKGWKGQR